MRKQGREHLPIGYWLKRADELLTQRIDEVQRSNGLSRLGWQALNIIRERGTGRRDDIVDTLQVFADPASVDEVVRSLAARGLLHGSPDDGWTLTPAGAELHERALQAQKSVRQRAVAGISQEEYVTTLGVLQRLVANLEDGEAP